MIHLGEDNFTLRVKVESGSSFGLNGYITGYLDFVMKISSFNQFNKHTLVTVPMLQTEHGENGEWKYIENCANKSSHVYKET